MAIRLVRKQSETPNIQNTDDCRLLRYAVANQNGYIRGYLNECDYQSAAGSFTVKSGELVLQGWQVGIDANGITKSISSISGTQYYICYLKIDLATETASVELTYDTTDYPSVPNSDDLTENTTGTAYLLLYKFTASSGTISNVSKQISYIKYTKEVKVDNAGHSDNADNATIAAYASSDTTKGTIEERLTRLGFSEGYITPAVSDVSIDSTKKLKRQGNYSCIDFALGQDYATQDEAVYHQIIDTNSTYQSYFKIGTLPLEYRPKEQTDLRYVCRCYGWLLGSHTRALDKMCIIKASTGEIFLDCAGSGGYYYTITYAQLRGTAGFECNPRT